MADAPVVNALKAIEKQMQEQNRLLKKISVALDSMNTNYVAVHRRLKDQEVVDAASNV